MGRLTITFVYPLIHESLRSAEEVTDVPTELLKKMLWLGDHGFTLCRFLMSQTYSKYTLTTKLSVAEIAQETKLSEKAVRAGLDELVGEGFIKVTELAIASRVAMSAT